MKTITDHLKEHRASCDAIENVFRLFPGLPKDCNTILSNRSITYQPEQQRAVVEVLGYIGWVREHSHGNVFDWIKKVGSVQVRIYFAETREGLNNISPEDVYAQIAS